jgi:hypothetical protein
MAALLACSSPRQIQGTVELTRIGTMIDLQRDQLKSFPERGCAAHLVVYVVIVDALNPHATASYRLTP